jgi:hypothetical protein
MIVLLPLNVRTKLRTSLAAGFCGSMTRLWVKRFGAGGKHGGSSYSDGFRWRRVWNAGASSSASQSRSERSCEVVETPYDSNIVSRGVSLL